MTPVIDVRRPPRDKKSGKRRYDGLYDEKGRPVCVGGKSMTYLGSDSDGDHWFRCPPGGCHLKDKIDWSRYCDSEHSERPTGKLLRTMGIIPRFSRQWREVYKQRTGVERLFSSAKRSRLLNQHQHLDLDRISLHANMSLLAWALTALTHLQAGDWKHMRDMRIKLPGRKGQGKESPIAGKCPEGHLCPECHGLAA